MVTTGDTNWQFKFRHCNLLIMLCKTILICVKRDMDVTAANQCAGVENCRSLGRPRNSTLVMVLNGSSGCSQVRQCKSIHIITLHFSNNHFTRNVYLWPKSPSMFLSFPLPPKIYFLIILTHATYLIFLDVTPLILFCAEYNNTALSPSLRSSQANR